LKDICFREIICQDLRKIEWLTGKQKADKFGSMRAKTQTVTRLDDCQSLLGSQINYTLTDFAERIEKFSQHAANRYLMENNSSRN